VEPKDKFAKPVMIEVREYTITFAGGLERVVRLTPDDTMFRNEDCSELDVTYADGRNHTLYLKHALDIQYRTYKQAVKPKVVIPQ
jgi:hypothetical protein